MGLLPQIEEADASAEVVEMYEEFKRDMGTHFVPNIDKTLAISPNMLRGTWGVLSNVFLGSSLPTTLSSMILFTISSANQCRYCGPFFQATCRTVGVDEESLSALVSDLEALTPRRVQEIVKFAMKCAMDRANVSKEDFDHVRAHGVSDEEIIEIICTAALANYLNTIADSVKFDVDETIAQALIG